MLKERLRGAVRLHVAHDRLGQVAVARKLVMLGARGRVRRLARLGGVRGRHFVKRDAKSSPRLGIRTGYSNSELTGSSRVTKVVLVYRGELGQAAGRRR